MVRSLVGAGHGCAILKTLPLTATSHAGDALIGVSISDPLPGLTLAIGYEKFKPKRLVQHFVDACRQYFATPGPARCVVDRHD
jgi:DNA-binding transcriptional LysR family regulator